MYVMIFSALFALVCQVILHAQGSAPGAVQVSNTGLESLTTQAVISGVTAYVLEAIKSWKWFPWFNDTLSSRAKTIVGLVAALATSLGVHASFDAAAAGGTLILTGVGWSALAEHGYDAARAWFFQQVVYDKVIDQGKLSNVGAMKATVIAAPAPSTGTGG